MKTFSKGLSLRANISWTFIGNTFNAGSWFAMTIVLAKLGSPEHVGQFALGLAITAPIFMFATLRLRDVQATDAQQEYLFGDYLALRLITTLLALVIVTAIGLFTGLSKEMTFVVIATGISKAIEAISDALYGLFMQHERMDRIAKSMMIKGPLSLLGLSIGFYLTQSVFWGVAGLALARFIILQVYDLPNAVKLLNLSPLTKTMLPKPRWNRSVLVRLFWLTLPLGFVTMLISFNINIPRYFIEAHLGAYYLGIFAAIASFQKVAPTVVQAVGRSASPRLAKYYNAGNFKSFQKLSLKLVGMGIVLGCAGIIVALLFGRFILTLFYGPEYAMPGLFALVMSAAGIDYIATLTLFIITSARYFKVQLPLHVLTSGSIALSAFFLIPSVGLPGAAIALIIGNAVRLGGSILAAWHAQHALWQKKKSSSSHSAMDPTTVL